MDSYSPLYMLYGLYIVAFIVSMIRMGLAQRKLLEVYNARCQPDESVDPSQLAQRYIERPDRWVRESPRFTARALDILWTPQTDAVVESARRVAARRTLLSLAMVALLMVLVFVPWNDL